MHSADANSEETRPIEKVKNDASNPPASILMAARTFIADAEALEEVIDISKPVLTAKQKEHVEELDHLISQSRREGESTIILDAAKLHKLIGLSAKLQRGGFLFRGHLLVALVSRFDGYISTIIRELLQAFPDRLGKKTLSYADAAQFQSMEELKKQFIEDEIDIRMRESHKEQLDYLSTLANVSIASDEQSLLAKFIEITERRNCHIHRGGRISPQYLRICHTHNVYFEKTPVEGQSLDVTFQYFCDTRRVLSEMAFKITQTIVRKLFPDSQDMAEEHLGRVNTIAI